MSIKKKFKFSIALLVQESGYILGAAEAQASVINPRLKLDQVSGLRTLCNSLKEEVSSQAAVKSGVGEFTLEQNAAFHLLEDLMGKVRTSAGYAFPGQAVKLHNEFQVGAEGRSLGEILNQARIIATACENNAGGLSENGWIDSDTAQLTGAMATLSTADQNQEDDKSDGVGLTEARILDANALYDGCVRVQHAGDVQFPARLAGNAAVRAQFRLDVFPPHPKKSKTPPVTPPTPPS